MKHYSALVLVLFLTACEVGRNTTIQSEFAAQAVSHVISLEASMSVLNDYLKNEESADTKSGSPIKNRRIASIDVVRADNLGSRSLLSSRPDVNELLYLVNFENNGGFALLSADDRIPEVLIGITDSGHLSSERLVQAYHKLSSNYQVRSGETFDPYDLTHDDWYIGNYTGTDGNEFIISEYVGALAAGYVEGYIGGGLIVGPMHPSYGDEGSFEVIYTEGGETLVVANMLDKYQDWCQGLSPYNDYIINNYYVGCVNIALGKILAKFSGPGTISGSGWSVNWSALNAVPITTTGEVSIAHLLAYLFDQCGSIPFCYYGTFTLPSIAAVFLQNFGYTNVSYSSYNTSTVKTALNNGCPVFVSAINMSGGTADITTSHAWNIDGYKNRTRYKTVNYYENGMLVSSSTSTEITTLVHCAFGWGGDSDGYFTSGIFQFYDGQGDFNNFCLYLKTITYNNPVL